MAEKEIWGDIPEFDGYYQASTFGRIKSTKRIVVCRDGFRTITPKPLKSSILGPRYLDGIGYSYVNINIDGKHYTRCVHRMVAHTFLLNPENKPAVNHKNFNINDNSVSNLEWVTTKENINYTISHGRRLLGEALSYSKLKTPDVLKIRELYNNKIMNQYELADMFGVSQCHIGRIVRNKAWKHLLNK